MAKFTAQREEAERRIAEIARQEMIRLKGKWRWSLHSGWKSL